MSASRLIFTICENKKVGYVVATLFWIIFAINVLGLFFSSLAAFSIIFASPEEVAQYPFGTEQGYSYLSREVYTAINVLRAGIYVQSVFASLMLYFSASFKKRLGAIFLLLLPFLLNGYLQSFDISEI